MSQAFLRQTGLGEQGQGVHSRQAEGTVCAKSLRRENAWVSRTMGHVFSAARAQPGLGREETKEPDYDV